MLTKITIFIAIINSIVFVPYFISRHILKSGNILGGYHRYIDNWLMGLFYLVVLCGLLGTIIFPLVYTCYYFI
jgi:hypothetical protein